MAHGPFRQGEGKIIREKAYDPYAFALTTIDEYHRLGHDGMVYHGSHKTTGLANGSNYDILISVGSKAAHMQRLRYELGAGDCDVLFYEGTTVSAAGTSIVANNTNRISSNTAETVITHTPTITGVGTILHTDWVPPTGAGVGSSRGTRDVAAGEEWILAPNTLYLARLNNGSGGAIDVRSEILWYEIDY